MDIHKKLSWTFVKILQENTPIYPKEHWDSRRTCSERRGALSTADGHAPKYKEHWESRRHCSKNIG